MIPEQPESGAHGDAWRAFCAEAIESGIWLLPAESVRPLWLWFLKGWLEKTKADADVGKVLDIAYGRES